MTWSLETSQGFESDKIAHLVVPYLQGRFLDLGCGMRTVWPSAIGIDNGHHFGPNSTGITGDVTDLSMFADGSLDGVFSSHYLEHVRGPLLPVLKEWWRVLRVGGHLVLYLPHKELYPNIGQPGANPDHTRDLLPGDIIAEMAEIDGWTLLENETRSGANEYSFFQVFRKEREGQHINLWQRNPEGKKRALVIRFGAIGDQIVASSCLPGLQKAGYHVTYMTTPDSAEVIKHDPHIDAWWIQAKDYVPNASLGPYWEALAERFDHIVNLSESVEGALLALPGRLQHGYPIEARRKLFGTVNYLERTHDIAHVPYEFAPKFYPLQAELAQAERFRRSLNGPVVVWAINGSSAHKVYPWTQVVTKWLANQTPCHVVLMADAGIGKALQDGILETLRNDGADMSKVHGMAGVWSIRQSLTFATIADCVIGPETGTLNAVCREDVPKVIYLSHSSHENLTKHWRNTTVLEPDRDRAPCYPCHRLHYGWEHCHQDEKTSAAACASAIAPEAIFEAVLSVFRAAEAA